MGNSAAALLHVHKQGEVEAGIVVVLVLAKRRVVEMDTNTFTGRLITGKADRNHSIKIQRGAYGHNTAKMRTDIVRRQATPDFPVEASKGIFTGKATYDTIS